MRSGNHWSIVGCLFWSTSAWAQHAGHTQPAAPTPPEQHEQHEQHAAMADLGAHAMLDDPLNKFVLIDRLETQDADGGRLLNWDLDTWIGRDLNKLWIRSAGERASGDTEHAELELLFGRSFARWWDLLAGVRRDFAPGDEQSWGAIGVRGLLPYRFEFEATAYVGDGGRTALRIETDYEVLITNRLILEPQLELDWHGQSDDPRGVGAGLGEAALGLRLRYELRREFAPYIGVIRERYHGRTAERVLALGGDDEDTRWVAGVRLSF